jgi:hypothetical protein
MELKYNKDGKLEFDLHSLLECAKDETRVELIESLSCDEAVIKHVVDQILDGWTENMFAGTTACGQNAKPMYALDIARREVSKRSSEVAKKTIEDLEQTIERQKQTIRKYEEEEWKRIDRQTRNY